MLKMNLNIISSIFKGYSLLRAYQIDECKNIRLKGRSIEFGAYKNKKRNFNNFFKGIPNCKLSNIYNHNHANYIKLDLTKKFKLKKNSFNNVIIFNLDKEYNLIEKIVSKKANMIKKDWILNETTIIKFKDGIESETFLESYSINSTYDYEKIISLFRNFDTMSFLDLILNYKNLQNKGYNKSYLDQNLNTMLSLPFFLFIMTALASILTLNALKKSNNFTFILAGLLACVAIYYFKDLSLALGQTDRISLSLAAWIPVLAIGLFSSIGILQINEK